jgi:hypothetical protein
MAVRLKIIRAYFLVHKINLGKQQYKNETSRKISCSSIMGILKSCGTQPNTLLFRKSPTAHSGLPKPIK